VQINDVRCMLVFSQIDRATPLRARKCLAVENLYVAIEWLSVPCLLMVGIWAVATRPPWRAIKSALLYMAFGLGATFALILMTSAMQVHDFVAFIVLFVILMYLSYVVAQKLDQL
jgi:hypothetical protein